MSDNGNKIEWNIIVSFLGGIGFLFYAIQMLLTKENVTPELFFALRLVLALGAGLVSAAILGNIKIDISGGDQGKGLNLAMQTSKLAIQAGGPIAITVLVWIYSPEVLHAVESVVIY